MHSYHNNGTTIHYNPDFSAGAIISQKGQRGVLTVPCVELARFVVNRYLRPKMIECIEEMCIEDLVLAMTKFLT